MTTPAEGRIGSTLIESTKVSPPIAGGKIQEPGVAQVLAIKHIDDFAGDREFPIPEKEGFAQTHIKPAVIRESREVALGREKEIMAHLPVVSCGTGGPLPYRHAPLRFHDSLKR